MSDDQSFPTQSDTREIAREIRDHKNLWIVTGVLLILTGLAAVAMPFLSSLAVNVFIGWCFVVAGIVRIISLYRRPPGHHWGWPLAMAIVSVVAGLVMILRPLVGIVSLTMVLMAVFIVEGIHLIGLSFRNRSPGLHWMWLLAGGLVNFAMVVLIAVSWPLSALWVIGLLTGINLFFGGLAFITLALAPPEVSTRA